MSRLLYLLVSLYLGMCAIGSSEALAVAQGYINVCTDCHGTNPQTNQAPIESTTGQRNVPARAIIGSHASHGAAQSLTCANCHGTLPTATNHQNGIIDLNATISGGSYNKTLPLKVSNTFVGQTCSATTCHGTTTPVWGTNTGTATASCTKCHGKPTQTTYSSANAWQAAPGYGQGGVSALPNGAHDSHLRGTKGYTVAYQVKCADCHAVATSPSHADGSAQLTWSDRAKNIGTYSADNGPVNPGYSRPTCSTNYCHGGGMDAAVKGNGLSPSFVDSTYLANAASAKNANDCNKCHLSPPINSVGGSHVTVPVMTLTTDCSGCHGHNGTGATHINGALNAEGCTKCHDFPPTTAAHQVHIEKARVLNGLSAVPSSIVGNVVCGTCHNVSSVATHNDNKTDIAVQSSYQFGTQPVVYAKGTTETCSNISCHLGSTPAWGAPVPSCRDCHGYPPVTTAGDVDNKHTGTTPVNHIGTGSTVNTKDTFVTQHGGCQICHGTQSSVADGTGVQQPYATYDVATQHGTGNINMNGPGSNTPPVVGVGYNTTNRGCDAACHANDASHRMIASGSSLTFGDYGTGGDCLSCHNIAVASPVAQALNSAVTTRVAVTPSFSLSSKHIRSRTASPAVTTMDCGVCHMEGNATTGAVNGQYHKNGRIELRDPDTGLTIKGVTHNGTTSTAGTYSSTATDATPVRFSRNLGSASIEPDTAAIMINQCLKCHDADGALSTSARVPGGSALKPFAGTIATNNGNVLNAKAQFDGANRAFHPIMARSNAPLTNAGGTRMVAPWNGVTKTGTSTVYGPLMTCWDCHAPRNTASTVTLTTSGVHGTTPTSPDNVELRGPVDNNSSSATTGATNLCIYCHVVTGNTTNHGTGSGITSSTHTSMTYFSNRCYYCHSSAGTTAKPTRPTPAADVHGYAAFNETGGVFPAANRGYAFFRRTGLPIAVKVPTGTPTCGTGVTGICSEDMGTYTPGGVY